MKKFFQFSDTDWEIVYALIAVMALVGFLQTGGILDAGWVLVMVGCFFVQRARNKRARLQNVKPGPGQS